MSTSSTESSTYVDTHSLHYALPALSAPAAGPLLVPAGVGRGRRGLGALLLPEHRPSHGPQRQGRPSHPQAGRWATGTAHGRRPARSAKTRSEEKTSELNSQMRTSYAVLYLQKKQQQKADEET